MSPTLNQSSVIQRFECRDVLEIHDEIIFSFLHTIFTDEKLIFERGGDNMPKQCQISFMIVIIYTGGLSLNSSLGINYYL